MRTPIAARTFLLLVPTLTLLSAGCGGPADVGDRPEGVVVCPGASTVEGVDVSEYQGSINWASVKGSGRGFAITRVGDGMYQDPTFAANWSGIKAAGMVRGAYQFFRPAEDPIAQANIFIGKVGVLQRGDLPGVLDAEVTDGQSAATIASHVQQWVDKVAAGTGKAPMIYTGKYFWNDNVGLNLSGNPLWLAAWVSGCPDTPTVWNTWKVWQYSDMGSVPGISARVDLDKFNGSMTDLLNFTGGPDWAAQFVSQSFPLAVTALPMVAGQRVAAYIEMRNTGARTWDGNTHLGTSSPRDRASPFYDPATWLGPNRLAGISGTVPPGGTYRFNFTFRAPAQTGDYHEYFNLVEEGVAWFSDPGQGGPPDNQLQAQILVSPAPPRPDAGAGHDAGAPQPPDGGTDAGLEGPSPDVAGDCSCRVGHAGRAGGATPLAVALLLLAVLRRRHRA